MSMTNPTKEHPAQPAETEELDPHEMIASFKRDGTMTAVQLRIYPDRDGNSWRQILEGDKLNVDVMPNGERAKLIAVLQDPATTAAGFYAAQIELLSQLPLSR